MVLRAHRDRKGGRLHRKKRPAGPKENRERETQQGKGGKEGEPTRGPPPREGQERSGLSTWETPGSPMIRKETEGKGARQERGEWFLR